MSDANRSAVRYVKEPSFAAPIGGSYASGTITFAGVPSAADTVTVNGVVYTFRVSPVAARDVKIGTTADISAEYLAAAINADPSLVSTGFYATTTENEFVVAYAASNIVTVYAKTHGTGGNAYTLAEAGSNTSVSGATLSGGTASNYSSVTEVRFNSHTLKHRKDTVESDEIRSDRTAFGMVQVGVGGGGDTNHELHLGDFNSWIVSVAMCELASGTNTQAMTIASGVLSPAVDWAAVPGILGAKYVKLSGRSSSNDGIHRVISISGNNLTLDGVTDEAGASGDTIEFYYARQGITLESYLVEVENRDTGIVVPITGCCINELALTMAAKAKIMARFGFIGYGMPSGSKSRTDSVGTSINAPSLNPIVNTTSHVPLMYHNGRPVRTEILGFDFLLNNNLRERPAISREGTLVPGTGQASISGRINAYFDNRFEYDDFLAHTDTEIEMTIQDSEGRIFNIYMPAVQMGDGTADVPGSNQDIFLNRTFKAKKAVGHDGTQFQVQFDMLEPD